MTLAGLPGQDSVSAQRSWDREEGRSRSQSKVGSSKGRVCLCTMPDTPALPLGHLCLTLQLLRVREGRRCRLQAQL